MLVWALSPTFSVVWFLAFMWIEPSFLPSVSGLRFSPFHPDLPRVEALPTFPLIILNWMPRLPSLCPFLVKECFSGGFFSSRSYSFYSRHLVWLTLGRFEVMGTCCQPVVRRVATGERHVRGLTRRLHVGPLFAGFGTDCRLEAPNSGRV